ILCLVAQKNWHLIEDCAHTLDGHYKGKLLGSIGDFGFHAIHKILPTTDGGILRNNNVNCNFEISPEEEGIKLSTLDVFNRSEMSRISAVREQNFNRYLERLPRENQHYRLLHTALPDGVVPLNFPVLIQNGKREQIYFKMIEKGAVPVALYHTLIPEVMSPEFSNTVAFSSMILNFPVHQDTLTEDVDRVCDTFFEILNQL
ncbi:MAG: DegT/DnrJ/EryC1/StrS family aminotransferase, partial [Bacteroidota bacterium]